MYVGKEYAENGISALYNLVFGKDNNSAGKFKDRIWSVTNTLTPKERDAVRLRFGLGATGICKVLTQKEISRIMGSSQPFVAKVLNKGIMKLRHKSRKWLLGIEFKKKAKNTISNIERDMQADAIYVEILDDPIGYSIECEDKDVVLDYSSVSGDLVGVDLLNVSEGVWKDSLPNVYGIYKSIRDLGVRIY